MKKYFLIFSLLMSILFADSEMGCSISELLKAPKSSLLENREESNCTEETEKISSSSIMKIAITENLMSVKVLHEHQSVLIEREMSNSKFTCPPFCIEPMSVKGVISVGELEVLAFIDKLQEKKARLLIDVRESHLYRKGTIPGAINLPFKMLKDESKYQEEVLTLLGAKLLNSKWSFTNAQSLLIFGSSVMSSEASSAVTKLLELGYPSAKLLYYRAGIASWVALGLTTL
jgi:rhodanese-related sulfurtransferase